MYITVADKGYSFRLIVYIIIYRGIPTFSEDRGLRFLRYGDCGYETLKYEEVKTGYIKIIKIENEETCKICASLPPVLRHFWPICHIARGLLKN